MNRKLYLISGHAPDEYNEHLTIHFGLAMPLASTYRKASAEALQPGGSLHERSIHYDNWKDPQRRYQLPKEEGKLLDRDDLIITIGWTKFKSIKHFPLPLLTNNHGAHWGKQLAWRVPADHWDFWKKHYEKIRSWITNTTFEVSALLTLKKPWRQKG